MTFYERVRQEHWLHDKQDEGKALILNDDSIWEVDARDQFLTKRWLRGSTIIVEYTQKLPVRDYLAAILPGFADLSIQRLADRTPTAWFARLS